MTAKKIFWLCFAFNVLWLALFIGMFAWTQPARAQAPGSSPSAPMLGPYYVSFSGADFHSYRDDFSITRDAYATVRQSAEGIGQAGLHLPPGAIITGLTNDSAVVSGNFARLRLMRCPRGDSNCFEISHIDNTGPGRTQVSSAFTYGANPQTEAYYLEVYLNSDNAGFYNAFVSYLLPSTMLFAPSILR
jgi:hypothetical protein